VPEPTIISIEGLQSGQNFKPCTGRYYRENLAKLTGVPSEKQVHAQ